MEDCDKALEFDPVNVRALYRRACAYKMLSNDILYKLTLKHLIEIQPHNQTILSEYYSSRHEPVPRKMRRLRARPLETITPPLPNNNPASLPASSDLETSSSTIIMEDNNLSYEELEQIRVKKAPPFTVNTRYQFTQQINTLKPHDMKAACSLILRLPSKGLFSIVTGVTARILEAMIHACRVMVYAERHYRQEHKSSILPFSYVTFSYNLLTELTTVPRLDSALAMIDAHCRAALDDLLTYASSISTILPDVSKLERLRK